MLILGQNDVSYGHDAVHSSSLTEPIAVIKFSDFSSHPDALML